MLKQETELFAHLESNNLKQCRYTIFVLNTHKTRKGLQGGLGQMSSFILVSVIFKIRLYMKMTLAWWVTLMYLVYYAILYDSLITV